MRPEFTAQLFLVILFTISCFKLSYCTTIGNINGGKINLVCPEIEREALLSFKASLEDPSNMLSTWNISSDVNCCNWKRVVCSNITGHVRQLHLQSYDEYQGLRGKINPSLVNLKHLSYLDLSQNEFEETIPSFIGSLTSLDYLNLSHAGFYGNIPHSIGNLSNLRTFSLEDGFASRLTEVYMLEWLSGLTRLEHINMNSVNLSRAANWLQVINTLPSLVELHFSYCSLDFNNNNNNIVNISTSLAILDLSYNNFIDSKAPPIWVFQLSGLIFLDLRSNHFGGPIPTVTNYTTKLQHIDLSWNSFNSTIPDWLYSLKDLEFLDLSNNYLQGPLSNDIANLTSLNSLFLNSNKLSGEIPRGIIANLCKMQTLYLSYNNFQGYISHSFENTSDCFLGSPRFLKAVNLAGNTLSGGIPVDIGKMSSLEYLHLGDNNLTGNLPESLGQLFNLEFLVVEDNKLEGVVSEIHFANLTKLKRFYASNNQFMTLNVSPNWIPPFELEALTLGSWNLGVGPQIPAWLETQKQNIEDLDLSNTGISGIVPSWIWKTGTLNLSHNHLHGNIHVITESITPIRFIYLSSNQFSGSLPQIPLNVLDLDFSNNSFSGELSNALCNVMTDETYNMRLLHLGGNQLTGEIPDCWSKWPWLAYLNLGDNMLSGNIPNSIGLLIRLRSLNLYNNEIFGQIPFAMHTCTALIKIDLANNDINGSIPTWMGTSLSNLRILILGENQLSGNISSEICHLNSLQILDLSDNKFYGIIPRCVHNFTAMATKRILSGDSIPEQDFVFNLTNFLESASVTTKGIEYEYSTFLALVTNIDLSNNNLYGDIPKELTSLVELRSLNLSGNHLTGLIPSNIGDMKQLESLDLSRNSLSGEIPNSFRVMSTLNYLNVSYNKLIGKIPESTQLRGFNVSSFIGNDGLCGPPLTSNCTSSGGQNNRENNHESGDRSSSKIEWLYVFVSSGYAVGLSIFCTTLVLKKSWREAYYEFMEEMWNKVYVYFYIKWRELKKTSV